MTDEDAKNVLRCLRHPSPVVSIARRHEAIAHALQAIEDRATLESRIAALEAHIEAERTRAVMLNAVSKCKDDRISALEAQLASFLNPKCSCDDIGEGVCRVHAREILDERDKRIAALEAQLARVREIIGWADSCYETVEEMTEALDAALAGPAKEG